MYKNTHECTYSLTLSRCEHAVLYCAAHTCVFLPEHVSLVCWQGVDEAVVHGWLYTYANCCWVKFLGKHTTQSAYMLSAPWATGSLRVHGAFCLMCGFDVCIKIISSLGICVLWEHWRPRKRNTWGGRVCCMAFTSLTPILRAHTHTHTYTVCCYYKY